MKIQIMQKSVTGHNVVISEFDTVKMYETSKAGKSLFEANKDKYALVSTFPEIASVDFPVESSLSDYEVWTNDFTCMNVLTGFTDYTGKLVINQSTDNGTRYNGYPIDRIIKIKH